VAVTIDFVENPARWIAAWGAILDESPTFEAAAAGWGEGFDGSLLLWVQGDDELADPPSFYVEPVDGGIRETRVVEDPGDVDAGFRLSGPYSVWRRLIQGEIHPEEAVTGGQLAFDGDLAIAMQYREAVRIMTAAASAIDTRLPD
jgi:putative sterol carrier protein